MSVSQIPGSVHLTAWIKVRDLPAGNYSFEMAFLSPQASLVSPSPYFGSVNVIHPDMPAIVYAGPASVPLSEPGFIAVRLKMTNAYQQVVFDQVAGSIFVGKQT
ncbi:hypothetical protein GFL85_10600 [Rhizobium laguerreae]|uniref:hypothetical protein n=1 Tax=Rhizobium laguerreae TaxID=1076926 RepID=UPI00143F37CA|nr:hypothetical protein [Rhizobium laguerreae]NKM11481.1 hypothetical protein [Rhizobium laguerreae]